MPPRNVAHLEADDHPGVDSRRGGMDGFAARYRPGDGARNSFVPMVRRSETVRKGIFAMRKGLLPAILLLVLPRGILRERVKLLPPWPERTTT